MIIQDALYMTCDPTILAVFNPHAAFLLKILVDMMEKIQIQSQSQTMTRKQRRSLEVGGMNWFLT